MKAKISTKFKLLTGITAGLLNGLFGSGGGVVAVPLLERCGLEQKRCHATSVVLIFFLSLVSTVMYALSGKLQVSTALGFIPAGLAGAVLGSLILKKINNTLLRRIFGIIILISAAKMFMS
ncbi:MAG: sulfite exporter TauE/SafE family protein [Oscillospiraceae bacterium]|nr:sulfite exporter TauE/SafE family protein [Oscillospiraceae bacterium]